jgi:anti-sigma factor RsiW
MSREQLTKFECPTEDIAAYIDGELDLARELELDSHFTVCGSCSKELNQQKQFLCGLNSGLQQERELELPENFTKQVVVNAESTVSGLRRPVERFNAFFICTGLFLVVLIAAGTEAGKVFGGVSALFEQAAIVGGFFGHLIYALFVGVAIVLRSLASQVMVDQLLAVSFMAVLAAGIFLISLRLLRIRI